jgi:hypothetical protein
VALDKPGGSIDRFSVLFPSLLHDYQSCLLLTKVLLLPHHHLQGLGLLACSDLPDRRTDLLSGVSLETNH